MRHIDIHENSEVNDLKTLADGWLDEPHRRMSGLPVDALLTKYDKALASALQG